MTEKTQKLMSQLAEIDCSFARYWNQDATAALEAVIANAPTASGRTLSQTVSKFGLTGRQETVLEHLLNFDQGRQVSDSLYILSGGQIKEVV